MNLKQFPLWTAVVTPFHSDLKIDYVSFEKLLLEQEEAKNGVVTHNKACSYCRRRF